MNIDNLEFVRIKTPEMFSLIPKRLFKNAKADFDIDKLYDLSYMFIQSPCTQFYIMIYKGEIHGILWAWINIFSDIIHVNVLSIDKEYKSGKTIKKCLRFVQSWSKKAKIEFITKRPKPYEKLGFHRSNKILMET